MDNRCSVKGCFGIRGLVWFGGMLAVILATAALTRYIIMPAMG